MSELRPINLPAEMKTVIEIEGCGFISIIQTDGFGEIFPVELSPAKAEILAKFITDNIESMRSRLACNEGR